MKKSILTFLVMLLILVQPVKAEKWEGSTGGTTGWGGGVCEECGWLYGGNGLGARISLYKYDGTNLEFVSSVDVINTNDLSFIGSKLYKTTHGQGRFYYTNSDGTVKFENTDITVESGKIVPISQFFDYNFEEGIGLNFETALINYLGEGSASFENMFNVEIDSRNLSQYYVVVEATATFRNVNKNFYTYGTGYEYMQVKDEWDKDEELNGDKKEFTWSLGKIIISKLYGSIYVKTDLEKENRYSGNRRYDYYNFVNPDNSGLITPTSAETFPYSKFSDFSNSKQYLSSNYPYGLTVLWIGDTTTPPPSDSPSDPKTCTATCNGKTGDALLECAEEYCASQADVNSTSTKAACITDKCKYNFTALTCSDDDILNGNDTLCSSTTSSTKKTCEIKKSDYYSYKIECTTNSTVVYPTSLPTAIRATEGFEYQVNLYGNKSCKITFDKEKWKFDYASSYTNAERDNYESAIEKYNSLTFTSTEYSYDSSSSNISIDIDEKISGKNHITTKDLQKEEKYYSGSKNIITANPKKETVSSYNEHGDAQNKQINIYTTDSSNGMRYHLPNVCISDKDRYTVEETTKSVCENSFGPYKTYYTDINSEKNKNNTKTNVVHNVAGMDVDNTCSYEIIDDSNDLSCYITVENAITSADGETIFYNNTPLTFKVTSENRENIDLTYNIRTNSGKICNGNTCIIDANDLIALDGLKEQYLIVTGTVSDGEIQKRCKKEVSVIKIDTPSGGKKCEFTVSENLATNETIITIKKISDAGAKYYFKQATSTEWIEKNTITISNNDNNEIIGKIITSDGKELKSESCYYENSPIGESKTCTNLYKPAEYQKIRDYCDAFWDRDTEGYSSVEDCYIQCTNNTSTPSGNTCKKSYQCSETTSIKEYCNISYQNDGYKSIEDCINDCSCGPTTGGINYVYRPISLTKPFPDRDANWNWFGYEKYITNDDDDPTSSNSGNPEYVIVLNSEKIKAIKDDTKNYNSTEGNDAYTDYVREDESQTGAYRSKFIHVSDTKNGGFSSYFTYIEGSKIGG